MESYHFDDLNIILNKEGSREFCKVSYPIRYGRFSEITTPEYNFQFNLNGEIKYIQGRGKRWPHPAEWLKHTMANDWIYYSAGGYSSVYDFFGEYYLPCLSYPSNSIIRYNPFTDTAVISALRSWEKLIVKITELISGSIPQNLKDFFMLVAKNDTGTLIKKSRALHNLIGGQIPVLPPDTRHVDYDVIPVIVADGCLFNCGFCCVKTERKFTPRTQGNIIGQIKALKNFYGHDLYNYNALFLGQNDALNLDQEILEFTARNAYEILEFERSYIRGAWLFLFGSVDSLLKAQDSLFTSLNNLPFITYINIGLESADPTTLAVLEKPISAETVVEAFIKMLDINRRYEKIELTANFVFGGGLPPGHFFSLCDLTRNKLKHFYNKGTVYLSPLMGGKKQRRETKRDILGQFNKIKALSRLPTFMYLIQRL